MAENVGKITVAIEAQTAELQQGLKNAEVLIKQTSAKIEAEQKTLGTKFKKSWTELSSKINVATIALNVAGGAIRGISGAMDVFAEKGTSGAAKVGGAIQAFGDAGIPIISQVIKVSEGIAEVFVQSAAKIREVQEALLEFQNSVLRVQKRQRTQAQADAMSSYVDDMATRIELMKRGMEDEVDMEMQLHIKRAQDRVNLENQLQRQIRAMGELGAPAEQMVEAKRVALELFDFETGLLKRQVQEREAAKAEAHQKELDRIQKEAQAKAEAAAREAKMIEDTTQGLRDTLAQLTARAAGDELGAQMIALEAKFRKMREGATGEQLALIAQIEAMEKDALTKRLAKVDPTTGEIAQDEVADGGVEDGGGRDATTSVSTAIGSFTVAMAKAGDPIQKKQTSLLERIATSNAKIADIQEKEKAVKEDVPTKETKIVEATKEKETKTKETEIVEATKDKEKESVVVVEKALTGMQKIAEDTQATIKDLTRQLLALGATEGQSEETKAKRVELRAKRVEALDYKAYLQREANFESDRRKMLAASEQAVPVAPTPQEVVGGVVERDERQIKQTTLLQKIADSNEKVADALSKRSNESIIVPA